MSTSANPTVHAVTSPAPASPDLPSAARIARARHATRGLFAALGLLSGVWGAHIPSLKNRYELNEASLSLVLVSAAVGAVLSLFFAGRVVARLGVPMTCRVAMTTMCLLLGGVLHWPGLAWLLPMMVVFGACMSVFDVSINTEGTALESLSGRTIMGNLHGSFSVGGMAGAALASLLLKLDVSAAWQLGSIALGIGLLVLWATLGLLDTHPAEGDAGGAQEEKAHFAWPRGTLLIIGLLIFAGMLAEGVMYDWCVLYLKQEVGMTQAVAAAGYAVFAGAMAVARFGGDVLRMHYSEPALLRGSGVLAAGAMAVVLLSGHPVVAFIGYALVGVGVASVVPILFNAATRVPGVSRAAAIASVSSIGYSGFLIGPPLIGGLAQAVSLTAAMGVVVVASALLALGAGRAAGAPVPSQTDRVTAA